MSVNITIKNALKEEEEKLLNEIDLETIDSKSANRLNSYNVFKEKIVSLPQDKTPIIIAGGSFNSKGRVTMPNEAIKKLNNYADLDFPNSGIKFNSEGEAILNK